MAFTRSHVSVVLLQVPELDLEIPPEAQRGSLSTVSPLKNLII